MANVDTVILAVAKEELEKKIKKELEIPDPIKSTTGSILEKNKEQLGSPQ